MTKYCRGAADNRFPSPVGRASCSCVIVPECAGVKVIGQQTLGSTSVLVSLSLSQSVSLSDYRGPLTTDFPAEKHVHSALVQLCVGVLR